MGAALVATVAVGGGVPASAAQPTPKPPVAFTTAPESPSPYQGQVSCDPVEKPGPTALRALLKATYGKANTLGSARPCSVGGLSEHKEGRAYDWMMNASNSSDKAMADAFTAWLTGPDAQGVAGGNAHRLGIQYVIWNKRTWQAWTGAWKSYTGASPHTDHVHVSFSWDGAMKRTSWWTGKAVTNRDIGPCPLYAGEATPPYSGPNYGKCPAVGPRSWRVVTGDFDGDGRTDVGSFSAGTFVLRTGSGTRTVRFGQAGDLPVAGDWDGDGKDGLGVFRNGTWYLRNSLTSTTNAATFAFGGKGYRPVAGDWDGDGKDSVGVYTAGSWYLRATNAATSARTSLKWGTGTDLPVAGDWNDDGTDTIGLFRNGYGWWMLASRNAAGVPVQKVKFGPAKGQPGVGDWNRDGRTTLGTTRSADLVYTDNPSGAGAQVTSIPF